MTRSSVSPGPGRRFARVRVDARSPGAQNGQGKFQSLLKLQPSEKDGHTRPLQTLMSQPSDARLRTIGEKVEAGQRLSFEDGLYLEEYADLFTLGELANVVRERKNGQFTYYNVNTHINPTNVCV